MPWCHFPIYHLWSVHGSGIGTVSSNKSPRSSIGPDFGASSSSMGKKGGNSVYVCCREKKLQLKDPTSRRSLPLLGAAHTDLPSRTDRELYQRIECPVLILSHGKDAAHPIETGKYLSDLLPQSLLEIVRNEDEAKLQWPRVIGNWLADMKLL